MIRQILDDYLDDALGSIQRSEIERQLAVDPSVAQLLSQIKAERALRAAVFSGYEPSEREAQQLSTSILAACRKQENAPAGRIGFWIKRSLGVAAAIALLAGTFTLGRFTAPQSASITPTEPAAPIICVMYNDTSGEPQMKEFASMDDANSFMKDMSERHAEPVVVASTLDAEHPGSF